MELVFLFLVQLKLCSEAIFILKLRSLWNGSYFCPWCVWCCTFILSFLFLLQQENTSIPSLPSRIKQNSQLTDTKIKAWQCEFLVTLGVENTRELHWMKTLSPVRTHVFRGLQEESGLKKPPQEQKVGPEGHTDAGSSQDNMGGHADWVQT